MKSDEEIERGWKESFEKARSKLKLLEIILPVIFVPIAVLQFLGFLPVWVLLGAFILFVLPIAGVLYTHIRCPNCDAALLSLEGFKSSPYCPQCSFKLSDKKTLKELKQEVAGKYGDRRANEIDWFPITTNISNASFDTHKLHELQRNRLIFKATSTSQWFVGGLFLAALGSLYLVSHVVLETPWLLLFPLVLGALALIFFTMATSPIIFDIDQGLFFKGKRHSVPLISITALQLLSKSVSSDSKDYMNYQLNAVLAGGLRENIVVYANKENAVRDAEKLASTLGVKLWHNLDIA